MFWRPLPGRAVATHSLPLLLGVTVITAVLVALRDHVTLLNAGMLYLLFVVFVSARWGWWEGVIATIAVNLALNFFFVPPFYRFTVNDPGNAVALGVFLAVAAVTSTFVTRARAREKAALLREQESALLYELSSLVISDLGSRTTLASICRRVRQAFRTDSCSVFVLEGDGLRLAATDGTPTDFVLPGDERVLALAAVGKGEPCYLGQTAARTWPRVVGHPAPARPVGLLPLSVGTQMLGVMRVSGEFPGARHEGPSRLLNAFAQVAAQAVNHSRLMREVTASRALQEADILKTALLSAVSHELRTPLGAIKASATALLDSTDYPPGSVPRDFLIGIDEQTDRLTRLVANLLDLSRIEGGALRPQLDWYDVQEFLETAINRLGSAVGRHRVALSVAPDTGDAHFDYVQMSQVVSNLIENAAKFSPVGSTISVEARGDGSAVTISVSDEGAGVEKADRERIFERFYRGSSSRGVPGTGLGLTISRGIVEAHGGSIRLNDQETGRGACFEITLPVADQTRRPALAELTR